MANAKTIIELAIQTRNSANSVTIRHKKKSSFELYAVLADCMEICERCLLNPEQRGELEQLFHAQDKGSQKRRYVEKSSDIYQLVCRFVFAATDRNNCNRYAHALREAEKLQLNSSRLEKWLAINGGVNALYFRRPLVSNSVYTRALRLNQSILIDRHKEFTLTLRWRNDNTFDVLKRD